MKLKTFAICAFCSAVLVAGCKSASDPRISGFPELDEWAKQIVSEKYDELGYPVNQDIQLKGFYEWYTANNLDIAGLNNVGDPFSESRSPLLASHQFEREVIEYFAPFYGIDKDKVWGIISNSGTDGNNNGIYFGVNYLRNKTGKEPIFYVSDEAHYSNMRLAHVQNLEMRLIKSDTMGRMIPDELDKAIDPTRPCLIVYAMGSTFKGAIDDQKALNEVLAKYPEMMVYRHVDAALFGGYLPFTDFRDMVSQKELNFQSIAISGHKFFGMDEPDGLLLTTKEIYDNQSQFNVPYLNENMKMINCSRSATSALKFWWLIHTVGVEEWKVQANDILDNTEYFRKELEKIGYPHWVNEYSNTVIMKRPSQELVERYRLACSYDANFGGDLSHIVVMQHVTKDRIDHFIKDLKASL